MLIGHRSFGHKESTDAQSSLELAAQVAGALVALHGAGALHRDLKPGNVLMRGAHRVVLTDFGLAKHAAITADMTDPGVIFGTPHYMSPEQGHGEPVDGRSDLYSLGVILYEMLAGEKPFTDASPMAIIYKHRNAPVPALPGHLQGLQHVVERLMAKRPADRYANALQAEEALARALAEYKALAAGSCRRRRIRPGSMPPWRTGGRCCWTTPTARRRRPPPRSRCCSRTQRIERSPRACRGSPARSCGTSSRWSG